MTAPSEMNLNERAEFFKALGHPVRLLILNLALVKPRHGEELALILNLTPATVSHHLALLENAGLLTSQKDQYYQVYSPVHSTLDPALRELVQMPSRGLKTRVSENAYEDKVLNTFFKYGRLVSIPAQLKKYMVVLKKIAEQFEPGRKYSEKEVNQALLDFHDDVASLRRGMIETGIMERDHGIYWLKEPPASNQG